jgi:cytochrome oxidase Cu insertion factor (SCO1/SenC/PrrC family)/ABC-type branched-subunit amino acid transport system substrate-binding protein
MASKAWLLVSVLFAIACGACEPRSGLEGVSDAAPPSLPADPGGEAEVRVTPWPSVAVPDEELVDQDGTPVRLRELAKDHVVAVNFIFTTCTTICSPMTAIFGRLQAELGDALERDVRLISITLDPAVDTPERLKLYADKFNRRPGWVFLTGSHDRVARALEALGGRAPVKERHTPLTILGRPSEGRWTRVDGIAPPRRLAEEIRSLLQPRGPAARSARGDAPSCAELTPAARRGKRIFQRGVSADGRPIEGAIVNGAATLSGREVACAGCHGPGGEGTVEGGFATPPITPERLSSPTRERRAYDAAALALAIREGRSPSSRRLSPVMPQYRLREGDLSDLVAYLSCVGRDLDPGVTEGALRLGAALPLSGPTAAMGASMREVLSAAFSEVNAQGGIFQRRIELDVEDSGGSAGEAGATAHLLDRGALALLGAVWRGDPGLQARLSEERAPLLVTSGTGTLASDGVVFQIQPGPDALARVAVERLAEARPAAPTADLIVHTRDDAGELWAAGARTEAARRGSPAPVTLAFEPRHLDVRAVASEARRQRARAILFWGPAEDLARCAAAFPPSSGVSIHAWLGSIAAEPEATRRQTFDRVLFLYSGPLGEEAQASSDVLRSFLRRSRAPQGSLGAQASAYVSARVLVEALKRAGAHVTREGLITALEGMRDFDAGPAPLVSFGRDRRIGVLGAQLVRLEPTSGVAVSASAWIDLVP